MSKSAYVDLIVGCVLASLRLKQTIDQIFPVQTEENMIPPSVGSSVQSNPSDCVPAHPRCGPRM